MRALAVILGLLMIGCGEMEVGSDAVGAGGAGGRSGPLGLGGSVGGAGGAMCADQWACGATDEIPACPEDADKMLENFLECPVLHRHNTHGTACVQACSYGFDASGKSCRGRSSGGYVYCAQDYTCSECTER